MESAREHTEKATQASAESAVGGSALGVRAWPRRAFGTSHPMKPLTCFVFLSLPASSSDILSGGADRAFRMLLPVM